MSRAKAPPPLPRAVIRRRVLVLLAPTLVALALAVVAMLVHRPTRVELVLTLDRFAATLAPYPSGQGWIELINRGQVRSVRIDRLSRVGLVPASLEVLDGSWRTLATAGELVLGPVPGSPGLAPAVTLRAADEATPGSIKAVRALAGTLVAMELAAGAGAGPIWLTLDLAPNPDQGAIQDADPAQVHLVFPGTLLLDADYLRLTAGLAGHPPPGVVAAGYSDSLSLRLRTERIIAAQGTAQGLVVQIEPAGSADTLLRDRQIPVSAVDFTRQGPGGEREGSLIAPGTLSYPDLPGRAPLVLSATDAVSLGPIAKARIECLSLASLDGRTGLKLTLDAVASGVRVGPPGQPRDARLTWFEWLWDNPWLRILFIIAVGLFPTSLAGYRLWQALRSPAGVS